MQLELSHIIGIFIALVLVSTWLIKKYTKIETHLFYSIWRMPGFLAFIRKRKGFGRAVSLVSELGLVLGFGVFGSDFLYGKKRSVPFRIALAVGVACLLSLLYYFTLQPVTIVSPITKPYWLLLAVSFPLFGISGFIVFALGTNAFDILANFFEGVPSCPGIGPLLPGVYIPQMPIFIPWYGWIAIFVSMVIHETSHGIVMLKEKLRLKGAGLLLVGIFPLGAFVEPDERELSRAGKRAQARVYSAGPSSNFLSLIPFWLIFMLVVNMVFLPARAGYEEAYVHGIDHVMVYEVPRDLNYCGNPPSPAYGKLEAGMVIRKVNGAEITSSVGLFNALRDSVLEPKEFTVEKNGEIRSITIEPNPVVGEFGFRVVDVNKPGFVFPYEEYDYYRLAAVAASFFGLMFLIAFLLGVANFMPLVPFDGGKLAVLLYAPLLSPLVKSGKKRQKIVRNFFLLIMLVVLGINALPLFL